jgi:hypothetical protein
VWPPVQRCHLGYVCCAVGIGLLWSEVNDVGIRAIPPAEVRRLPSACAWAILVASISEEEYMIDSVRRVEMNYHQRFNCIFQRSGVVIVEKSCAFPWCLSFRLTGQRQLQENVCDCALQAVGRNLSE